MMPLFLRMFAAIISATRGIPIPLHMDITMSLIVTLWSDCVKVSILLYGAWIVSRSGLYF